MGVVDLMLSAAFRDGELCRVSFGCHGDAGRGRGREVIGVSVGRNFKVAWGGYWSKGWGFCALWEVGVWVVGLGRREI